MTRPVPLLLLALVFVYLGTQLSTTMMWIIVLVGFAILVGLIIAMSYRNMYRGPKTLADDIRQSSRDFFRDRDGEAERVMAERRAREIDDEIIDEISDDIDRDKSR